MKALRVLVIALSVILAASPAFAVGNGWLTFNGEPYISLAGDSFYLTVPEIQISGYPPLWIKWKFNLNNISWEIDSGDFESNVSGQHIATGKYVYDAQKGVLILDVQDTNFLGCGFNYGVIVWFVSALNSTTAIITDPLDDENFQITLTRVNSGNDILGTWTTQDGNNTYSITFNRDNTFIGQASIVQCASD